MHGIWTALITPFTDTFEVDFPAYRSLLRRQINAHVNGVIPCGSTGEVHALTLEERKALIQLALEECQGSQTQVIPGVGGASFTETLALAEWASHQNVHGILAVTPCYSRPSPLGLKNYFTYLADAIECPLILYNVPSRTGVSLSASMIAELALHPRISGLKDASGSLSFLSEVRHAIKEATKPFSILSGDDVHFLPSLALGASGIISVASHLFPAQMAKIQTEIEKGNLASALKIHEFYYPLFRDLFIESNPSPIKYALHLLGQCKAVVRPPLSPMLPQSQEKLRQSLIGCELYQEKKA